ncbi:MerR family transcriptional regulator [Aminobacter anthyllidis]|uniref:MerR family transcriptional regulator n=1 Tax=Aminobacter anthyllidis TaxID=1035067 RepID=UPI002458BE69|nr:MerR family transcriptional regulator [Aminobacter anthyllidis]MDH4989213.1 MerR family transcriptional regulator [Aminobacter anthyllidis]
MTDSYLLAGRFGAATRLSPKALRLYAEQGLLVPVHIDPQTGYRYYASSQAPRARLISRLRRLGLPIARVTQLLELTPEARVVELQSWLSAQNDRLADQAELVRALSRQAEGGEPALTATIGLREVSATKVVSRQRQIGVEGLDDFIAQAETDIRTHLRASGLPDGGLMSVHFHDLISRDSEGLIEIAVACEGSLEPAGDLLIRLQPARREVFLPVPRADEDFPRVMHVYDALEAWLDARRDLSCTGSPCETYPGTQGARFDVAYPIT